MASFWLHLTLWSPDIISCNRHLLLQNQASMGLLPSPGFRKICSLKLQNRYFLLTISSMFIHNFRLCCTSGQPLQITFCLFHLVLHLQIEVQNSSASSLFDWKHCLAQKQLDWGKTYFLSHFLSSRFTNKVATKPQNCPLLEGLKFTLTGFIVVCHWSCWS